MRSMLYLPAGITAARWEKRGQIDISETAKGSGVFSWKGEKIKGSSLRLLVGKGLFNLFKKGEPGL